MPIPLPNLDDRTFTDLVEEMRSRIARYSPEWTDHNISDPGIMLLELFAWLTEAAVYQINRVPDYSTMQFLKMVGVTIQSAQPAILKLAVEALCLFSVGLDFVDQLDDEQLTPELRKQFHDYGVDLSQEAYVEIVQVGSEWTIVSGETRYGVRRERDSEGEQDTLNVYEALNVGEQPRILPRGTRLSTQFIGERLPVTFETMREVTLTETVPRAVVTARQITLVTDERLGVSSGTAHQLFSLAESPIVLPTGATPVKAVAFVDEGAWEFRTDLRASGADDPHFTVKIALNAIAFGDGTHGKIPPNGAKITVNYRYAPTIDGEVVGEKVGVSNGKQRQFFRLTHPFLATDLNETSTLTPQVTVDGEPWTFRQDLQEINGNARQFVVDPWRNAIRFGNYESRRSDTHGRVPPAGSEIRATYHYTLRPAREIAEGTHFVVEQTSVNGNDLPDLRIRALSVMSQGDDPISLDEARVQAHAILQPRWRAIANDDFKKIIEEGDFDIARAQCLPSRNTDAVLDIDPWTGHVSVALLPQARHELRLPTDDLDTVVAFRADGDCLVAVEKEGYLLSVGLDFVDCLGDKQLTTTLREQFHAYGVDLHQEAYVEIVQPGSEWTIVNGETRYVVRRDTQVEEDTLNVYKEGSGHLWNLRDGNVSTPLGTVKEATFTADGTRLLTADSEKIVRLWDATTGEEVWCSSGPASLEYGPRAERFATVSASGEILLRDSMDGNLVAQLHSEVTERSIVFRPDERMLATFGGDHVVHVWDMVSGALISSLLHPETVGAVAFLPDGRRVVTAGADREIRLWWIENGDQLSTLSYSWSRHLGEQEPPDEIGRIEQLIVSPDGTRLVAVDEVGRGWLWSLRSRRLMADLSLLNSTKTVSFSGDGRWLTVTHDDAEVGLWDARAGTRMQLLSHVVPPHATVFSPGSCMFITLSGEFTVKVWDLSTIAVSAAPVFELTCDAAIVGERGNWFGCEDGNLLHLWGTEPVQRISSLYQEHTDAPLARVSQVDGGKYLYVVGEEFTDDGEPDFRTLTVWDAEHTFAVDDLLQERRLIASQHHIAGAQYTNVRIEAEVVREGRSKDVAVLQHEIAASALYEFFHPLRGGPDQTGWSWGRPVHASEVYQILEGISGVDHVDSLIMKTVPEIGQPKEETGLTHLSIPPLHLVNYVVRPADIKIMDMMHA